MKEVSWQGYVDMFAGATEHDDEPVMVPIFFDEAGFAKGGAVIVCGEVARNLAGIGAQWEIARARNFILEERAKLHHLGQPSTASGTVLGLRSGPW